MLNIFRTSSTVRTTMVVRLTPGESRRLSAFLDQKVAYSITELSHTVVNYQPLQHCVGRRGRRV